MNTTRRVLLLGRTNVGKSTLFNRLVNRRIAITDHTPHTTRDLQEQELSWRHATFTLVDSGGFDIGKPDDLHAAVLRQVQRAIEAAEVVVLVTDMKIGFLTEERNWLRTILASKKSAVIAINKADRPDDRRKSYEMFHSIPSVPVSAKNGGGTGDLLDAIADVIEKNPDESTNATAARADAPTFTFIGRTNVGKSSLVNAALKDEVRVVAPTPHTTRDAANLTFTFDKLPCHIIDTAGVRVHGKTNDHIEAASYHATLDALDKADVAIMVWNVAEGLGILEKALAGDVVKKGIGLVCVGNQWDRIPGKTSKSTILAERNFRRDLPYISWAPIVFTSATKPHNVHRIFEASLKAWHERQRTLSAADLAPVLKSVIHHLQPIKKKGWGAATRSLLEQISTKPPSFALTTTKREALPDAFRRMTEKAIRATFGFPGSPIRVSLRQPYGKKV